jgi:RNA polymerase sigma-70 factor (ECF subfamily)
MLSLNEQFSQIYDQYIEKIYRFVYLKVSSREVAEDITSKVFIKGWEAMNKQGADIKNPSAFLYQIARNSVIDYYRQKGRTNVVSADAVAELADAGIDIQDKAILNADVAMVKIAIQKLKKEYQDVLIWHYLEDMPIGQIAEMINKKEGNVRVILHRGLKDLKDIIKES